MSTLAKEIDALDFGIVFEIVQGQVEERHDVYAPNVYHCEANDIYIEDDEWSCFTGLTGQYGYTGAVMHSSEYIGKGIADYLLERSEDYMFVIVTVDDLDDAETPVGWVIAYKDLC